MELTFFCIARKRKKEKVRERERMGDRKQRKIVGEVKKGIKKKKGRKEGRKEKALWISFISSPTTSPEISAIRQSLV